MKFVEIKVGELKSFVGSDSFHQMTELPISTLRVHSQSLNPIADPTEISNLFIHKCPLKRIIAWPAEMDSLMEKEYLLQDGDGDAVFT
jgi:hypothetical protein